MNTNQHTSLFFEQIKREMERQGITQTDLAKSLDCARPLVSRLMKGNSNLTMSTATRLANALGMNAKLTAEPTQERKNEE